MQGIRLASKLLYSGLILILLLYYGCSKKEDSLYILFEKNNPHMYMSGEASYKFWVNEEEFFLFEPKDKYRLSKQTDIKEKIVDIEWLSKTYRHDSQKVIKCLNVYIVEKIGADSVRIIPVKVYEGTE